MRGGETELHAHEDARGTHVVVAELSELNGTELNARTKYELHYSSYYSTTVQRHMKNDCINNDGVGGGQKKCATSATLLAVRCCYIRKV